MLYRFIWILLQPFALFIKIIGKDNIPKDKKPIIIVANHIGETDPAKISMIFPFKYPIHWFTKREAFKVKEIVNDYQMMGLFRWVVAVFVKIFVTHTLAIAVDRESTTSKINRAAIRETVRILKNSGRIGIFGEGGVGREGSAHPVFVNLAIKTGADIIPVKIHRSSFWKITVGNPINQDDKLFNKSGDPDSKQTAHSVMRLIQTL